MSQLNFNFRFYYEQQIYNKHRFYLTISDEINFRLLNL